MDQNMLESNERTLVIFDSVCSGLAECLALVHADIRQMAEHRNQLSMDLAVQERLQLKPTDPAPDYPAAEDDDQTTGVERRLGVMQTDLNAIDCAAAPPAFSNAASATAAEDNDADDDDDDDPHHLARLKLLDKRLADSFSQALSMCDQQKSSLVSKKQSYQANSGHHRPSILQVLLGKGSSGGSGGSSNNNKSNGNQNSMARDEAKRRGSKSGSKGKSTPTDERQTGPLELDNRVLIDDINRQTRMAMQYAKQLEAHLFRVEDLRANYEMHLKMGLVVRSVSRAYSSSASNSSSAHQQQQQQSPDSLGRGPNRCASSLLVNDNTSSLGTTRSSLSSLNLSSWSFSRRNKSASERSSSRHDSSASGPCCRPAVTVGEGGLSRHQHRDHSPQQSQKYVSTISLDSTSKRNKRLGLAKLISMSSSSSSAKRQHESHQHQQLQSHFHMLHKQEAGYLPQQQHNNNNNYNCNSNINASHYQPDHQESWAPGNIPPACQCQLRLDAQHQPPVICANRCRAPPSPSPRPVSQYGDFIAPAAMGSAMSRNACNPAEMIYISQHSAANPESAILRKSLSQSSLKNSKSSRQLKQQALASKTTIREFVDNIERIESELESYMGSFLLNIEDIQGFARVCQGDVFEINIKYGQAQKFKAKISVLKDSRQKCDNRQTLIKARIADVIAIKAYECKGLGKRVLLGHKLCETRDLFTARSQLMTISLNQTGSIKLNLVITWNPLHMAPNSSLALPPGLDISHISLPPTPLSSSTLSSLSSARSSANGHLPMINSGSPRSGHRIYG